MGLGRGEFPALIACWLCGLIWFLRKIGKFLPFLPEKAKKREQGNEIPVYQVRQILRPFVQ